MILGIGCDIARTARFAEIIKRNPQRLKRLCDRILHEKERVDLDTTANAVVVQKLASAWAAKEALYKSLNVTEQSGCRFNRWRKAWVNNRLELICDSPRTDQVLLTLSHDGEYTMAMVVRQAAA